MPQPKENSKTEESATCPVCYELFSTPRRLPTCKHTFCQYCLEQFDREVILPENADESFIVGLNHSSLVIRCPICRATSAVGDQGITGFEIDDEAQRNVEKFRKENNMSRGRSANSSRQQRRREPRIVFPSQNSVHPIVIVTGENPDAGGNNRQCPKCNLISGECCSRTMTNWKAGLCFVAPFIIFSFVVMVYVIISKAGVDLEWSDCMKAPDIPSFCRKYFISNEPEDSTWNSANSWCKRMDGNLANIRSLSDLQVLRSLIENIGDDYFDVGYWLAISRDKSSGIWTWGDNKPVVSTRWLQFSTPVVNNFTSQLRGFGVLSRIYDFIQIRFENGYQNTYEYRMRIVPVCEYLVQL